MGLRESPSFGWAAKTAPVAQLIVEVEIRRLRGGGHALKLRCEYLRFVRLWVLRRGVQHGWVLSVGSGALLEIGDEVQKLGLERLQSDD